MICKWYSLPSNADLNNLRKILLGYCSCIDVETNLQSYITIEGHEEECVDELAQHLIDEGCIMNDGEVYNKPKVIGQKRDYLPTMEQNMQMASLLLWNGEK